MGTYAGKMAAVTGGAHRMGLLERRTETTTMSTATIARAATFAQREATV